MRLSVRDLAVGTLDRWSELAAKNHQTGSGLQYGNEVGRFPPLLADPLQSSTAGHVDWVESNAYLDGSRFGEARARETETRTQLGVNRHEGHPIALDFVEVP